MSAYRDIATRITNAENSFISNAIELHGFTEAQAKEILAVYKKAKVIKICPLTGQYTLKHGVFAEADIMKNALTN
jgi:hypothetical protein